MNRWLTSLLYHVNRSFYSWDKTISNSDLEIWRSRSWVWSTGKVIRSDQYLIDSLIVHFKSIKPIIHEIWPFRNWTLKIQDQGHTWGQRPRSHAIPSIQPMHFFSFYINRTNHSWDMSKRVLDPQKHIRIFLEKISQKTFRQNVSNI